jgi:hypothetical protein
MMLLQTSLDLASNAFKPCCAVGSHTRLEDKHIAEWVTADLVDKQSADWNAQRSSLGAREAYTLYSKWYKTMKLPLKKLPTETAFGTALTKAYCKIKPPGHGLEYCTLQLRAIA